MKVDLYGPSPSIPFGKGDSAFKLIMRRIKGEDRMNLLDAVQENSFASLQRACGRLVEDWAGVCSADGTPLPFKFKPEGEGDRYETRFDDFMGAVSFPMQLRVLAGIMAFCGIPKAAIEDVIGRIEKAAASELNPTTAPHAGTPGPASGA